MINLGVSLSHKVGRTVIGSEDIWMHHLGGIPSHQAGRRAARTVIIAHHLGSRAAWCVSIDDRRIPFERHRQSRRHQNGFMIKMYIFLITLLGFAPFTNLRLSLRNPLLRLWRVLPQSKTKMLQGLNGRTIATTLKVESRLSRLKEMAQGSYR